TATDNDDGRSDGSLFAGWHGVTRGLLTLSLAPVPMLAKPFIHGIVPVFLAMEAPARDECQGANVVLMFQRRQIGAAQALGQGRRGLLFRPHQVARKI